MSEQLTLKQRIHNSEIINIGGAPTSASKSELEAILGQDSYDLIGTDAQHSAFNEEKLVAFCTNLAELGMPVQLRIKHTRNAYLIGNILDLGPLAIVVPQVETEATVDEAINAFLLSTDWKTELGDPAQGTVSIQIWIA